MTTEYLTVEDGSDLLGALPIQHIKQETSSYYGEGRHRAVTGGGHWLLVGTRRAYRSGVLVKSGLSKARQDEVVGNLVHAGLQVAAELGCEGILLLYSTTMSARLLKQHGATSVIDEAEAELSVEQDDLEGFFSQQDRHLRHMMRREWRRFMEAGYDLRRRRLSSCWRELVPLLSNLQEKYGHSGSYESLGRRLQSQALSSLDDSSTVFSADIEGHPCAFALNFEFSGSLYLRMAGFEYSALKGAYEYFAVAYYDPIRYMCESGLTRLHLGIEALDAKVRRGAALKPLWTVAIPTSRKPLLPKSAGSDSRCSWIRDWPSRATSAPEWNSDALDAES